MAVRSSTPARQWSQVGCELIGSLAPAADAEVILLANECLQRIGIENISIDLTLPTLVPNLLKLHALDSEQHAQALAAIGRRDAAMATAVDPELGPILAQVIGAVGPARPAIEILETLAVGGEARTDIERLVAVVGLIEAQAPGLMLTVDPVERRGFEYHTGLSFALFGRGWARSGGVAATVPASWSTGEPATGFTLIADHLLAGAAPLPRVEKVFLPLGLDPGNCCRFAVARDDYRDGFYSTGRSTRSRCRATLRLCLARWPAAGTPRMTHQVIEAQFDPATAGQLELARQKIYELGFGSLPAGIPHVSLSSFQNSQLKTWQECLPALATRAAIEVEFSYLGIFRGESFIIYMGIIPSRKLTALHEDVHRIGLLAAGELHARYYPDRITFHSTLAAPVKREDLGVAIQLLTQFDLPRTGTLNNLALVEYFPAVTLLTETLGS